MKFTNTRPPKPKMGASTPASKASLKLPLSRKEKASVIEEYIKLYPERSDNCLAEDLGVDKNTVADKREELESTCEIHKLNKTIETKREELEEKGQVPETGTLKGKDGKEGRRNELEGTSEIPKCSTAQTKDGKEYPRKQSKPKPPKPEPVQGREAQAPVVAAVGMS